MSPNLQAAGLTGLAMALFSVSDAVIKLLASLHPPGQILTCRGALAVVILWLYQRWRYRRPVRPPLDVPVCWLRSLAELAISFCFFMALARLPLGVATAVLFAFPLFLTAGAALLLGEAVGRLRWAAVGIGLAGVAVICRPGAASFEPAALWSLAAAGLIALRDLLTRRVPPGVRSGGGALMAAAVTALGGLLSLPFGWTALTALSAAGFLASAAVSSAGFVCMVAGTRIGEVSFAAPFRYLGVPLAMGLGWAVWGHVPAPHVWLGGALVVAAGLIVLGRPRRVAVAPLGGRGAGAG